jgi:hypothetical protein
MGEHVRTPWKVDKELTSGPSEWLIAMDAGDRGRGIGIAYTCAGSGQSLANAKFIVKAANYHDRLVKALEQTTSELLDEIRVKYSEDDLKYPSMQRSYRADIAQVEENHKLLKELKS